MSLRHLLFMNRLTGSVATFEEWLDDYEEAVKYFPDISERDWLAPLVEIQWDKKEKCWVEA